MEFVFLPVTVIHLDILIEWNPLYRKRHSSLDWNNRRFPVIISVYHQYFQWCIFFLVRQHLSVICMHFYICCFSKGQFGNVTCNFGFVQCIWRTSYVRTCDCSTCHQSAGCLEKEHGQHLVVNSMKHDYRPRVIEAQFNLATSIT